MAEGEKLGTFACPICGHEELRHVPEWKDLSDDLAMLREYIDEIEPRGYGQAKRARLRNALNRISGVCGGAATGGLGYCRLAKGHEGHCQE